MGLGEEGDSWRFEATLVKMSQQGCVMVVGMLVSGCYNVAREGVCQKVG